MPIASLRLGLVPLGKFVFSQQDARRYAALTAAHLRSLGVDFVDLEGAAGVGHWRLKGGDLTVVRLASLRGEYSLAFGEGRGTPGPETVGTYVWMEVDDWLRWERKFIRGPYLHHVAGIHGKLAPILWEACRYLPGMQADPVDKEAGELDDWWWR